VWVRVPGVHTVPLSAVRVRFRELSFDVSVADLGGKDYTFAVRTLARARRTRKRCTRSVSSHR
jgi:hypothetical protein